MTTRHQSCRIVPSGDAYSATFGLCDHTIGPGGFTAVDDAATAHMIVCPPRESDGSDDMEREFRHHTSDGYAGVVGTLCFLMLDGCTDTSCPCFCHNGLEQSA
jgi:hypothetical protein